MTDRLSEKQVDALIAAYLAGSLPTDALPVFERWLRASPENPRRVARLSMTDFCLHEVCQDTKADYLLDILNQIDDAAGPVEPVTLHHLKTSQHNYTLYAIGGAAAAVLVLAITLVLVFSDGSTPPSPTANHNLSEPASNGQVDPISPRAVAALVRTYRAQWSETTSVTNGLLSAGPMELTGGFAELELADGTRVIVQGPSRFDLIDGNSLFMYAGRLVADVPERAHGFTVQTPGARVVDLGTEFAVSVREDAGSGTITHTQVFQGEVEMSSVSDLGTHSEPKLIRKGEAMQAEQGDDELVAVTLRHDSFVRAEDLAELTEIDANPAQRERWMRSLALAQREDVVAYFDMSPDPNNPNKLANLSWHGEAFISEGTIVGATATEGRHGGISALAFGQGNGESYVQIKGHRELDAVTLAAWVKVDRLDALYTAIMNTDNMVQTVGGVHWQIYDEGIMQFTAGSSSLGVRQRLDIPSTHTLSAGDGLWHHLAVTFDTKTGVVTHYFDGRQVGRGQIPSSDPVNLFAARIGDWSEVSEDRQLHGAIDELLILNRGLTEDEVQHLFKLAVESQSGNRGASTRGARPTLPGPPSNPASGGVSESEGRRNTPV